MLLVTAHTLDAVVTEPALGGDLRQRWLQTVDMGCNIAHLANDDLVFVIGLVAVIALFAVGAFPLS